MVQFWLRLRSGGEKFIQGDAVVWEIVSERELIAREGVGLAVKCGCEVPYGLERM